MTVRPMTRTEALAEARRRWGAAFGMVRWGRTGSNLVPDERVFDVGEWGGDGFDCRGTGPTWEAAFADADRRERAK